MANKRYADVAAARHMRDAPLGPQTDTERGKRTDPLPRPPAGGRAPQSEKDRAYRKKRLVALVLTTLVCLSVPTLITLLVLFG
ncbi:hypothetical protein [Arthrobacter sp. 08Y14]|uniref:hypothetical protein n=1 Tax=Arthrobacter sp. 08Y14 TaxID=2058885 RepID=UPI000CE34ABB|nr:hypothetical protein [Arthrobacter sp. 08Y14]